MPKEVLLIPVARTVETARRSLYHLHCRGEDDELAGNHDGRDRLWWSARRLLYFKRMHDWCEQVTRSCPHCAARKGRPKLGALPSVKIVEGAPNSRVREKFHSSNRGNRVTYLRNDAYYCSGCWTSQHSQRLTTD